MFNSKTINSKCTTPTVSYDSSNPIKSIPQVSTNKPMNFPKPVIQENLPQSTFLNDLRQHIHENGSRNVPVSHMSRVSENNRYSHQNFCGPDKSEATNCEEKNFYYYIPDGDLTDLQTLTQNAQQQAYKPLILTPPISGTNNNWGSLMNELKSRKETNSKDINHQLTKNSVDDLQVDIVLYHSTFFCKTCALMKCF